MAKLQRRKTQTGQQYTVTVPIRFVEAFGWQKGTKLNWKFMNKKKLMLHNKG